VCVCKRIFFGIDGIATDLSGQLAESGVWQQY
jgi:hypothetical protein